MRLIDLIEKHDDESILMGMGLSYNVVEEREDYRRVLGILRTTQPETGSRMRLCIKLIANDEDGWYDVSGHDGTMRRDVEVDYDLEYLPWEDWIGMEIEEGTLASMQEVEIIVHSLWNMTFVSFDPNDLQWVDGANEKDGVWSCPLEELPDGFLDDFLDELG